MSLRSTYSSITRQYEELDAFYGRKEGIAAANNWNSVVAWREKRKMNDAIHFLFAFARFEGYLKERSEQFLLQKSSNPNYRTGISWKILKEDAREDKLHFKRHLRLFIDNGHHNFNTVIGWYDIRNQLAHGGPYNIPLNVKTAMSELLSISRLFII